MRVMNVKDVRVGAAQLYQSGRACETAARHCTDSREVSWTRQTCHFVQVCFAPQHTHRHLSTHIGSFVLSIPGSSLAEYWENGRPGSRVLLVGKGGAPGLQPTGWRPTLPAQNRTMVSNEPKARTNTHLALGSTGCQQQMGTADVHWHCHAFSQAGQVQRAAPAWLAAGPRWSGRAPPSYRTITLFRTASRRPNSRFLNVLALRPGERCIDTVPSLSPESSLRLNKCFENQRTAPSASPTSCARLMPLGSLRARRALLSSLLLALAGEHMCTKPRGSSLTSTARYRHTQWPLPPQLASAAPAASLMYTQRLLCQPSYPASQLDLVILQP